MRNVDVCRRDGSVIVANSHFNANTRSRLKLPELELRAYVRFGALPCEKRRHDVARLYDRGARTSLRGCQFSERVISANLTRCTVAPTSTRRAKHRVHLGRYDACRQLTLNRVAEQASLRIVTIDDLVN